MKAIASVFVLLSLAATTAPTTAPSKTFRGWKDAVALIPSDDMPTATSHGSRGQENGVHWGKVEREQAEKILNEKLVGSKLIVRSAVNWVRKEEGSKCGVIAGGEKDDRVKTIYCTLMTTEPDDGKRLGLKRGDVVEFAGTVKSINTDANGHLHVALIDCRIRK